MATNHNYDIKSLKTFKIIENIVKNHNSCNNSNNVAVTTLHNTKKNLSNFPTEFLQFLYVYNSYEKRKKTNTFQIHSTNPLIINASEPNDPYIPLLARCYSNIRLFSVVSEQLGIPLKNEEDEIEENLFKMEPDPIVPEKLWTALDQYAPKYLWKRIHPNKEIALEMAMILCSLITQYRMIDQKDEVDRPHTTIASSLLIKLFGSAARYIAIVRLLEHGTKKNGAVIERDHSYWIGGKCKGYRFTEHYSDKGLKAHTLRTFVAQKIYRNYTYRRLSKASSDPIVKHILETYPKLQLPTVEELKERAKELIAEKYLTNKGKILKFRGKKGRNYYKKGKYSFVEDDIKRFSLLCHNGFLTPIIGEEASGGRVVDSFTLLPSWIRDMIKIDGTQVKQYDYTALHPNIALDLYGSKEEKQRLNGDIHSYLAEKYQIDRKIIKVENLSFFNKHPEHMQKSPLWELYSKEAPEMLRKIIAEKREYTYKVTSRKLFEREVSLMREVILEIEKRKRSRMSFQYQNCSCIYVYDALYTGGIDISEIMNEVALKRGILTYV